MQIILVFISDIIVCVYIFLFRMEYVLVRNVFVELIEILFNLKLKENDRKKIRFTQKQRINNQGLRLISLHFVLRRNLCQSLYTFY